MDYTHAVFIGRFQPPHKVHFEVIRKALELAPELIIVIGSARSAPSTKNPFTFEQRKEMFLSELSSMEARKVHFVPVRDYFYSENIWVADVQRQVSEITGDSPQVAIVGSYKDASSYYLNLFPQWDAIGVSGKQHDIKINSTDIREQLFEFPGGGWHDKNPRGGWTRDVTRGVEDWIKENFLGSNESAVLQDEHIYLEDYRKQWEASPYPPTFVTADAVVTKSGHVLVVKRRVPPGQMLFALPGGFIRQNELIKNAALRELKEETRIGIDKVVLERNVVDDHVFDYPSRSLRGRTITHAFFIDLGAGKELPRVKGGDDASGAFWMPLMDVGSNESGFFEDHFHIINYFINRR